MMYYPATVLSVLSSENEVNAVRVSQTGVVFETPSIE